MSLFYSPEMKLVDYCFLEDIEIVHLCGKYCAIKGVQELATVV